MPNPSLRLLFGVVSYAIYLALLPRMITSNDTTVDLLWPADGDTVIVRDDRTNVSEDVSVKIKVLRNDLSPIDPWDSSSLEVVIQPVFGNTTVDIQGGCIIYTPSPDYYGPDSLVYNVCNLSGACGQAMVWILVHPINDPPVVHDDLDTTWEDEILMIDIMANDNDDLDNGLVDPMTMQIHGIRAPLHGSIEIDHAENKIRYRPNLNYFGNDYFEYSLCDSGHPMPALCDTAGVKIHVRPTNDPPQLNKDIDSTFKDLLAVVEVLANDYDTIDEQRHLDWSSLSTDGLIQPHHGFTYVDNEVGLIVYVPTLGFTGVDSFQYSVCDKGLTPAMCDTTWVIIHVLDEEIGSQPPRGSLIGGQKVSENNIPVIGETDEQSLIFPNPAIDEINIIFPSSEKNWESFYISNSVGQRWQVYPNRDNNGIGKLRFHNLSPGIYYLICTGARITNTYSFIVE